MKFETLNEKVRHLHLILLHIATIKSNEAVK